jgi:hypothetical protein
VANRTSKGCFVKGRSGNPRGRPKRPPEFAPDTAGADRRTVGNLVIEARKFSGLAVDTLVELTKDTHTDSTRYAAATALLDRGYGRPAQSLDLPDHRHRAGVHDLAIGQLPGIVSAPGTSGGGLCAAALCDSRPAATAANVIVARYLK